MVDRQKQHEIFVHFRDKAQNKCVRTGNNAAWLCQCGYDRPLVGYSDELNSPRDYSRIICPGCGRVFRIVAPGLKKVPKHVQEMGGHGQTLSATLDTSRSVDKIPELVRALYGIIEEFNRLFPDRPFTPDGHLVGSIGEVIAAHKYNLCLLPPSTEGHDALAADGKRVEIKTTQSNRVALRNKPDHLLVLKLHKNGATKEVYNGPGIEPWSQSGSRQKNGQLSISLRRLEDLMKNVSTKDKI